MKLGLNNIVGEVESISTEDMIENLYSIKEAIDQDDKAFLIEEVATAIEENGWNDSIDSLFGAELREAGIDTSTEGATIAADLRATVGSSNEVLLIATAVLGAYALEMFVVYSILKTLGLTYSAYAADAKAALYTINANKDAVLSTKPITIGNVTDVMDALNDGAAAFATLLKLAGSKEKITDESVAKIADSIEKASWWRKIVGKSTYERIKQSPVDAGWTIPKLKSACENIVKHYSSTISPLNKEWGKIKAASKGKDKVATVTSADRKKLRKVFSTAAYGYESASVDIMKIVRGSRLTK